MAFLIKNLIEEYALKKISNIFVTMDFFFNCFHLMDMDLSNF
jgi:hypothetical protein